jgi:hypothetical protein
LFGAGIAVTALLVKKLKQKWISSEARKLGVWGINFQNEKPSSYQGFEFNLNSLLFSFEKPDFSKREK